MKPSFAFAALLLVSGSGCKKPPAAPIAEAPGAVAPTPAELTLRHHNWTIRSAQGAEARQVAAAENNCTVTCTLPGGAVAWARPGCLGLDTDFRFLSADCGALVVLYEYPDAPRTMTNLVVGTVNTADQEPVALRVTKFIQDLSTLRVSGRHVQWLAGVLGVPGEPPRLSADGNGVAFVTIDKVPHAPTFAAFSAWVDTGPIPDRPVGKTGLYQWVNAEGTIQVGSLDQIPPRFRSKAARIDAEVNVMVNDHKPPAGLPAANPTVRDTAWDDVRFRRTTLPVAPPAKPTHDADGRPIVRNERGEDWLEYSARLNGGTLAPGGPPRGTGDINDRTTPTCKWEGAKCGTNFDCCSGACVGGACK